MSDIRDKAQESLRSQSEVNRENVEQPQIQEVSPSVIYEEAKAEVDVQISTAKNFPRSVKRAIDNSVAIVTLDEEIARTCHYALPRGGKSIDGPTVHLAKILAQNWGNMRIEAKVIAIDQKHVTSQAIAFDLENNLAVKVEVKRSIMGRNGRFNDDMITITGSAANSIALRNAVFAVIPRGVVDKVYRAAKQKITGDVSEPAKLLSKRVQVVNALKESYSVTEKEILTALGKASIDHIDGDDLVTLIGIGTAIKDGDTTVEDAFRRTGESKSSPIAEAASVAKEKQSTKNAKPLPILVKMDSENNFTEAWSTVTANLRAKVQNIDDVKKMYQIPADLLKTLEEIK